VIDMSLDLGNRGVSRSEILRSVAISWAKPVEIPPSSLLFVLCLRPIHSRILRVFADG